MTASAQDLLQLAREHTPREIAATLGISASSVRKRLNRLGLKHDLRATHRRPCLSCARDFKPEHRFNRLCPNCCDGSPDYEVKA